MDHIKAEHGDDDREDSLGKRPYDDQEDGNMFGKRQRSSNSRSSDVFEVRILIPANTAGAIIGKSGSNIKELRNEFNTNVQIPDSDGYERVVAATLQEQSHAVRFVGRIAEALNERMRQDESECSVRLLVHQSQAGTIIGKKGARIKELREQTGAKIKVNQECCPGSTDRVCQITGTVEVIEACTKIVLDGLQAAPPRGEIQFYDPSFVDDSYDYGGFNTFDRDCPFERPPRPRGGGFERGPRGDGYGGPPGRRGRGRSMGGGRGGYGRGGYGGAQGGYGGGRGYDEGGYQDDGSYGGGYDGNNGGGYDEGYEGGYSQDGGYGGDEGGHDDGTPRTTQVTIPTSLAGSIIGKGGQRIRQIRLDSGAQIKIDEELPGTNERIITITGTADQTQNAQFLLQKSVKMYSGQRW